MTILTHRNHAESEVTTDITPQFYTSAHQSAVRAVAWVRVPPSSGSGSPLWDGDPTVIATGGYDGSQGYIDIRDGLMNEFNRTRGLSHLFRCCLSALQNADVVNDIGFSPYITGAVSIDHENSLKMFSVSPISLGKGHNLFNAGGPIWVRHTTQQHWRC